MTVSELFAMCDKYAAETLTLEPMTEEGQALGLVIVVAPSMAEEFLELLQAWEERDTKSPTTPPDDFWT